MPASNHVWVFVMLVFCTPTVCLSLSAVMFECLWCWYSARQQFASHSQQSCFSVCDVGVLHANSLPLTLSRKLHPCWQAECRVQLGVTWPFDFKSLHDIQLGKLPSLPHPVCPSRHHTCFTSCHLMLATSFSMTIWKHGWFVAHLYSTMGPPLDLVFSFVCDEIWQSPHLFPFNTCVQTHALNGTDPMHLTIVWEQKCGPHARLGGVFVYIVSQQTECHMLHAQVQCCRTLWTCPCLNVGQQVACTGTMRSDTGHGP